MRVCVSLQNEDEVASAIWTSNADGKEVLCSLCQNIISILCPRSVSSAGEAIIFLLYKGKMSERHIRL